MALQTQLAQAQLALAQMALAQSGSCLQHEQRITKPCSMRTQVTQVLPAGLSARGRCSASWAVSGSAPSLLARLSLCLGLWAVSWSAGLSAACSVALSADVASWEACRLSWSACFIWSRRPQ